MQLSFSMSVSPVGYKFFNVRVRYYLFLNPQRALSQCFANVNGGVDSSMSGVWDRTVSVDMNLERAVLLSEASLESDTFLLVFRSDEEKSTSWVHPGTDSPIQSGHSSSPGKELGSPRLCR